MTQEQAIAIADKMYDIPTTFDKDTSEYKRWEDVFYRWRLYNKDGIYINLTVYRIEESALGYRVMKSYINDSTKITVATKKDLASLSSDVKTSVYVENEGLWYARYTDKIWLIDWGLNYIYSPCFYIEYFNDNKKVHFRAYFNHKIPCWKTIEAAKQEIANLSFESVDLVADEESTFFFIDKQCSHLFDPYTYCKNRVDQRSNFIIATTRSNAYITPTSLVPSPNNGQAFMMRFSPLVNGTMDTTTDYDYLQQSENFDGIIEGVQANGGNSRIMNLLQEWSTLEKSNDTNYVKLADATTSEGYASLVQSSDKEGA